jgi:hypothetical protein
VDFALALLRLQVGLDSGCIIINNSGVPKCFGRLFTREQQQSLRLEI